MQYFKSDVEVNKYCEIMEDFEIVTNKCEEAISRIKVLENNIKAEARRELEKRNDDIDYLVRDSCETIIAIINFHDYTVEEIYSNLENYIIQRHNKTFIDFHPVMRRIEMLVKSMKRIYNKYCVHVSV